jgi:endoglucanase
MKIIWTILTATLFQCGGLDAAQAAGGNTFTPSNPPEMKPLTGHDSPAHRAAQWFKHGVNLGDYLEVPPNQGWGVTVSADEFAQMKRAGFDHVRLPVGWQHYAGAAPDFTLAPEIFARVDFVITNALNNGLAVMINVHHFNELDRDPAGQTEKFLALWRQIAAHYQDFTNRLAFELDNEPHENATTGLMNPIYARAIAAIRRSNPNRTIFVEPGNWGGIDELKNLVLPPDGNMIVSVHCYDPYQFTHQGAGWAGPDEQQTGIQFPGPPAQPLKADPKLNLNSNVLAWIQAYNTLPMGKNPSSAPAFADKLKFLRAWSDYYGYPVHIGEFGCYLKADPASRARYYSTFRHAAEQQDLGWAIWDWSANFRYWDKKTGQPMPGMHEALFGKLN